jgi:putative nucleotidyltransferase with HDIG domain
MVGSSTDGLVVSDLPDRVVDVLRAVTDAGHEVALVGGCVRERLRRHQVAADDWDAATSAHPEEIVALFGSAATWENRFGTVTVGGAPPVEVTAYRTEGGYSDRRRPDEVRFGATLDEDLSRRDFTINAIAWVPVDLAAGAGHIVDPFGGRADLAHGVLRTVGDPRQRFGEDALRLVRAARFGGRLGLRIDPETEAAIRDLAPTAAAVSGERIAAELERMLLSDAPPRNDAPPSHALLVMERLGLLAVVLPEVAALRGVPQAKASGGDALDHTLAAVDAADPEQRLARWAALLHDIGKATTGAHGHFLDHEKVGAEQARAVLARLRRPSGESEAIVHVIRQHMYGYDSGWSEAAVRRFIRRVGEDRIRLLFALRRADNRASGAGEAGDRNQDDLERRVEAELRDHGTWSEASLAVDGHDLQRELGLEPGPRIGRLLDQLLEAVLDDPSRNRRADLIDLARRLEADR